MMKCLFWISALGIFYAFVGYPISLVIIKNIFTKKEIKKNNNYMPRVSMIIAAHNEEKSIIKKLENTISLDYDKNNLEIIVTSDNSTDSTNEKVLNFIEKYPNNNIILYKVKQRMGKTNAQNEAIDIANGEIIAFSDANSMWDKNALNFLVQNFYDKRINYVCGKLKYVNSFENITSNAETTYWNFDLWMRGIESDYGSITAGNGAIYAIRKEGIKLIPVLRCHDGLYPTLCVLDGKRAIYEENALAFEKAGENSQDEFSRKVRMNRGFLKSKYGYFSKFNPLKTGIFSYFYICHRYLRYSLYLFHILLFISSGYLSKNIFYRYIFYSQIIFYLAAVIGAFSKKSIKIFYFPYYYTITIFSQLVAIIREILGKDKPFWEKAESTR